MARPNEWREVRKVIAGSPVASKGNRTDDGANRSAVSYVTEPERKGLTSEGERAARFKLESRALYHLPPLDAIYKPEETSMDRLPTANRPLEENSGFMDFPVTANNNVVDSS